MEVNLTALNAFKVNNFIGHSSENSNYESDSISTINNSSLYGNSG